MIASVLRPRLGMLVHRRRQAEWMDETGLDADLHVEALVGLERINLVSRTAASVWAPIHDLLRRHPCDSLSVLDVACGAGDLAIALSERARRHGVNATVHGCDISATAIGHAMSRARACGADVQFYERDVLAEPPASFYDVIVCSLFVHHLPDDTAARLLQHLQASAGRLLVVTDLNRGLSGLILAWLGTRLLSRSPVVHVDAIRSVRAAFTRSEIAALAARVGLPGSGATVALTRQWPCRWRLVAERAA